MRDGRFVENERTPKWGSRIMGKWDMVWALATRALLPQIEFPFTNETARQGTRRTPETAEPMKDSNPTRTYVVRRALEEDILEGRLQPGDRLDEHTLAQRFNVSRTPIREALHQLSAAAMVEIRPRRGAVVTRLTMRQLLETLEVLAELEGLAARLAVVRMSGADVDALRAVHEECEALAEVEPETDAYYEANRRFHTALWQYSRNSLLIQEAHSLYRRGMPFGRHHLRTLEQRRRSVADHARVVEAVLANDSQAAYEAMRGHVSVQGDLLNNYLATLPYGASR